VSSYRQKSALLECGRDIFIQVLCQITGHHFARVTGMMQDLPKIQWIACKKIKPKKIILIVSQQHSLVGSGHEDLLSNHLLAEVVCGKAAVSVGLNLSHPHMR